MTHADRVQAVAAAFGQPETDVERWPIAVVQAFHRCAIARGWLHAQVTS
jgi:hypothetical protein